MSASEYAAKYSHYDRTCGGVGGHNTDAVQLPQDCPDCYGRGLCARCAPEVPKYSAECPSRGWRVFNAADAIPGRDYV